MPPEPTPEASTTLLPENKAKVPKEKKEKKHPEAQKPQPKTTAQAPPKPPQPAHKVSLETSRFPFPYYLTLLRDKVAGQWRWPASPVPLTCVVYFRIQRDGQMTHLEVKTKSDNSLFDQAALSAVALATPFPPLPTGYAEEYLGVYFEFSLQ